MGNIFEPLCSASGGCAIAPPDIVEEADGTYKYRVDYTVGDEEGVWGDVTPYTPVVCPQTNPLANTVPVTGRFVHIIGSDLGGYEHQYITFFTRDATPISPSGCKAVFAAGETVANAACMYKYGIVNGGFLEAADVDLQGEGTMTQIVYEFPSDVSIALIVLGGVQGAPSGSKLEIHDANHTPLWSSDIPATSSPTLVEFLMPTSSSLESFMYGRAPDQTILLLLFAIAAGLFLCGCGGAWGGNKRTQPSRQRL